MKLVLQIDVKNKTKRCNFALMIVITGARGFIGSNLVQRLNNEGFTQLILVDELEKTAKDSNLESLQFEKIIHRSTFISWLSDHLELVDFIFHLGARTDTTELDETIFNQLNLNYSKALFEICTEHQIPVVYASSAATYGDGNLGYNDTKEIKQLKPLNPYGWSKQNFDLWVNEQTNTPPFWAGLKFFNVYGKHENHKGRMASVILHAYKQISKTKKMQLFMSHREDVANGEQKRDFIAVEDVVNICIFFYKNQKFSGLYNVGSGQARSFNDLVSAVFKSLNEEIDIEYIPTPLDIRHAYQYFTQADMNKLRSVGYSKAFLSLEDGVKKYIQAYLSPSS